MRRPTYRTLLAKASGTGDLLRQEINMPRHISRPYESTVLAWARSGIITPAERGSPGHPYRFRLDAALLKELEMEKQKLVQRGSTSHRHHQLCSARNSK